MILNYLLNFSDKENEIYKRIFEILWNHENNAISRANLQDGNRIYLKFCNFVKKHLLKAIELIPQCEIDKNSLENVGVILKKLHFNKNRPDTKNQEFLKKRSFPSTKEETIMKASNKESFYLSKLKLEKNKRDFSENFEHLNVLRIIENADRIEVNEKYKKHMHELFDNYMLYVNELKNFECFLKYNDPTYVFDTLPISFKQKRKRKDFNYSRNITK